MRHEDKNDRQLGEGDRRKQFFESFFLFSCTISNINKLNCCWSDCENSAIYFDSWNLGYCIAHIPEAGQC